MTNLSGSYFEKDTHTTKWFHTRDLSVTWIKAQRLFRPTKAKKIADNFDPDMFGIITVTLPDKNGIRHIIDGQHRIAAIRSMWGDDQKVPCHVIPTTDPKRAAEIFDEMHSNRQNPSSIDLFLVRVTAERELEVVVHNIITRAGYRVSSNRADGDIRAVNACVNVYKRHGGPTLINTFAIIRKLWGKDVHATEGSLISGIAEFLAEHNDTINKTKFVEKVSDKFTPGKLMAEAKTSKGMFSGTMASNVSKLLVATYNQGLRKRIVNKKAA